MDLTRWRRGDPPFGLENASVVRRWPAFSRGFLPGKSDPFFRGGGAGYPPDKQRRPRVCPASHAVHVLNRAAGRHTMFEAPADYDAFVRVVERTVAMPLPVLALAVMPNH